MTDTRSMELDDAWAAAGAGQACVNVNEYVNVNAGKGRNRRLTNDELRITKAEH